MSHSVFPENVSTIDDACEEEERYQYDATSAGGHRGNYFYFLCSTLYYILEPG